MAELRFYFGTMGSGKSTQALQIHHNLTNGQLQCLLMTRMDRNGGVVSSRLGVAADAVVLDEGSNLFELVSAADRRAGGLHAVICDEAQFYRPDQVEDLALVVDQLGIEVYAFGLLTSFQGLLFPGTQRLLEVADRRYELQVEARCWCGARATHNARYVNGTQVYEGDLMVVGDAGDAGVPTSGPAVDGDNGVVGVAGSESGEQSGAEAVDLRAGDVSYGLRCRRHWLAGASGGVVGEAIARGSDGARSALS